MTSNRSERNTWKWKFANQLRNTKEMDKWSADAKAETAAEDQLHAYGDNVIAWDDPENAAIAAEGDVYE